MKSKTVSDNSESIIIGEWDESKYMQKFSLQEKETDESESKRKTHVESWKTLHRKWKSDNKKLKVKFDEDKKEKLAVLKSSLKVTKTNEEYDKLQEQYEKLNKSYYSPTDPPFPASDVTIETQADYLAAGEYVDKPYDQEALTELIEGNQRLKSSVGVAARNSVGLGQSFRPTKGRKVADYSEDEQKEYYEQGRKLLEWYNSRVEQGKKFYQIAYEVDFSKFGLGEGIFEIVDNRKGEISKITTINPTYIYEGKNLDRYIWIKNGKKKYFKRFDDKTKRSYEDFSNNAPLKSRATRLLKYKEYNLISDVYGVSNWTGAIPQILGARYAAETNVHFFNNRAEPRFIITIAGGAVDDNTIGNLKKYFQTKGKGRENVGRAMLLCVSSKNQLSPNSKPPTIKIEPITVGLSEDASFMKYQAACEETIREAFNISSIFYGSTGGGVNRATSYTSRDLCTTTVFIPEGEIMTNLCNDTFTKEWAVQEGYIVNDEDGEVKEDNLLAEIFFTKLSTMSQKDEKELSIMEVTAGALTINDYRSEVLGLSKIDKFWADMPRGIAISILQFSEISPTLIGEILDNKELVAAIKQDKKDDFADEGVVIDDTVKALMFMRKGLNKVLEHKHVDEPTIKALDMFYSSLAEDNELINNLLTRNKED